MPAKSSRRPLLVVSLGVAALALAACASSKKAAAPPTTKAAAATTTTAKTVAAPDPCTLVTQAQGQAIVGVALGAGVKSGSDGDTMCQFTSSPDGPTAQVEVFVGDGAKKQLDIDKDSLQHPFTTIPGVGDQTYLEAGNVFVHKDGIWVSVNVVALDAPDDQVQTGLTNLASTIAGEI